MTDRWQQYFKKQGAFDRGWLKIAVTHWGFHEILYGMITRHRAPPARILDVGCGPGWSDLYLASLGYEVTGIDNDPRLVDAARTASERLGIPVCFEQADAFDLTRYHTRFDLVYSCGVLEHFDREITVELLREQARCAPRVLIQIPTRYTAYTGEIVDERIYTLRELRHIVEDAGMRAETTFGYGDVTATKTQIRLRRLLPRGVYRALQNLGFAYSIAVVGRSSS